MEELNKTQRKCPSCGAVIEHNYNHRCPYCRQKLHVTDDNIKKINNCDYKVQEVEICRMVEEPAYIITIRGIVTPKLYYYEENNKNDMYVSDLFLAHRVGYNIKIPFELLQELNSFENLMRYILDSIPPELDNYYNRHKIFEGIYPSEVMKRWLR